MVIDNAVAKESIAIRNKAEDGNDAQVGAPMKGEVVQVKVAKGDLVEKGQGMINPVHDLPNCPLNWCIQIHM